MKVLFTLLSLLTFLPLLAWLQNPFQTSPCYDTKNIGIASGLFIVIGGSTSYWEGPFFLTTKRSGISEQYRVYFVPSLEYLRKGGRISEAIYRIGSMLTSLSPHLRDENGKYTIAKKTRGWQKSLAGQIAQEKPLFRRLDSSMWEFVVLRLILLFIRNGSHD